MLSKVLQKRWFRRLQHLEDSALLEVFAEHSFDSKLNQKVKFGRPRSSRMVENVESVDESIRDDPRYVYSWRSAPFNSAAHTCYKYVQIVITLYSPLIPKVAPIYNTIAARIKASRCQSEAWLCKPCNWPLFNDHQHKGYYHHNGHVTESRCFYWTKRILWTAMSSRIC